MLPMKNNGANIIYSNIISPFVKKHEAKIDDVMAMTEAIAREGGKERKHKVWTWCSGGYFVSLAS